MGAIRALVMVVAAVGMFYPAVAAAQRPAPPSGAPSSPGATAAAMTTSELLTRLNTNDQLMIEAGHMAEQKGVTAAVRRYGDRILRDHNVADHLVRQVAFRTGMNLQSTIPGASPDPVAALKDVKGPDFDRRFLLVMKQQNQNMVQLLNGAESSVRQAPSAPMTALIDKMLPLARVHLLLTQALLRPGAPI